MLETLNPSAGFDGPHWDYNGARQENGARRNIQGGPRFVLGRLIETAKERLQGTVEKFGRQHQPNGQQEQTPLDEIATQDDAREQHQSGQHDSRNKSRS